MPLSLSGSPPPSPSAKWRLELDEDFFRIYDSKKMVMGYFDPDYGEPYPPERRDEIIESMLKNHDVVTGGIVMVPMVKFGLFDTDLEAHIDVVQQNVLRVNEHIGKWRDFLAKVGCLDRHAIRISHTDQDMLTVTFPIKFHKPLPLGTDSLAEGIKPTLDLLLQSGLS